MTYNAHMFTVPLTMAHILSKWACCVLQWCFAITDVPHVLSRCGNGLLLLLCCQQCILYKICLVNIKGTLYFAELLQYPQVPVPCLIYAVCLLSATVQFTRENGVIPTVACQERLTVSWISECPSATGRNHSMNARAPSDLNPSHCKPPDILTWSYFCFLKKKMLCCQSGQNKQTPLHKQTPLQ